MDHEKYIGRLLDNRYEIQEVLGVGGMAVVYVIFFRYINMVATKLLTVVIYALISNFSTKIIHLR